MTRVYIGEEEFAPTGGSAAQSFKCDTIPDYDANSTQDDAINMNVLRHYNEGERNTLAAAVTAGNQATTNLTNAQTGYANRLATQETKASNHVLRKLVNINDMTDITSEYDYDHYIEDFGVSNGVTIRIGRWLNHTPSGEVAVFLEFVDNPINAHGHLVSDGEYRQLGSGYVELQRDIPAQNRNEVNSKNQCLSTEARVRWQGEDDYEVNRCLIALMPESMDNSYVRTQSYLDVADQSYKSVTKAWTVDVITPRHNEDNPTEVVTDEHQAHCKFLLITIRTAEV